MASTRYLSGVVWSGANAGASVLLPLVIFVFFARLLPPVVIGAVALSSACIDVLKTFTMPGLYEALLQQREGQPGDIRRCHETAAAVMMAAAAGMLAVYLIGLAVLGVFVGMVATHFLAFAVLGLQIVLDIGSVQPTAWLARTLAIRRLAARGIIGNAAGGALGIATAMVTDPFTGLVVYQVAQSSMVLLTTVLGADAMAMPRFHRDCFARLRHEAMLASGVRFAAATGNNLDQIIVAAMTGSLALAFFNLGKRIQMVFVTVGGSFNGILFQPHFAHARAHGEADGETVGHGIAVLTIILGLPAAVFVPNSTFLITTVFGQQWLGAGLVAAVLALGGFVRGIGFVPGALLSVSMRNRELLLTGMASALSGAALVALAAPLGIVCCATVLLVKDVGIFIWVTMLVRRHTRPYARTYLFSLVIPFLLMLASTFTGRWMVGDPAAADGVVRQFLLLTVSVMPAIGLTALYFAFRFKYELTTYYAVLRSRWTARA